MRPAALLIVALILTAAAPAAAQGRAEYYFPPVTSVETFDRAIADAPPADRSVRIGFVTQFTRQQLAAPHAPRFALFAKGAEAEEMIVVALDDAIFSTIYRARAVLAQLSAPARVTEFFVEQQLSEVATFFDMLKLMGFASLTISDGATWSHRVEFR